MPGSLNQCLSFWNLFIEADWVVKSVIVGLVVASIFSWSIISTKYLVLKRLCHEAQEMSLSFSESMLQRGESFFHDARPFAQLIQVAAQEYRQIHANLLSGEKKQLALQRLEQKLSIKIDQQREELNTRMGVLASVGSTAPFVGLFGTVWGIMSSFQCIASAQNTSLAIVAPGIAEALFATAIGLVVAIPAVIAYNKLTLSIQSYNTRMENFAQEIMTYFLK